MPDTTERPPDAARSALVALAPTALFLGVIALLVAVKDWSPWWMASAAPVFLLFWWETYDISKDPRG